MALTARAGLLALLGAPVVGLLMPSWAGVAVVTGLVLAAVLLDVALAGDVRALRMTRSGAGSVRLGEPVETTLRVLNPGGRTVRGTVRDAWPPGAGAGTDRHPLLVPPGQARTVVTRLRPRRRGDLAADRVTVRAVGPLRLAARQRSRTVPGTVRALPPFTSRRHLPAKLDRLRALDGRNAARVRGPGTEFDSLRSYVAGDDVRSIDWRATARADEVVVRTWRPERDRHVLLVLDTGRTAAGRVGDGTRLDTAMDAALLLGALASRAGDRVELLAYDREVRAGVSGVSGSSVLPGLVEAMAPLTPRLVESDARGMVGEIVRRTRRRSLVVLLTGLDPAPLEEGLLPVLPSLTGRHRLLVAAVADPEVARLARGRGDADAVYGAAAAERTLAERRHVTALLARHGTEVVDAVPDELAPALADRYLTLKARGHL